MNQISALAGRGLILNRCFKLGSGAYGTVIGAKAVNSPAMSDATLDPAARASEKEYTLAVKIIDMWVTEPEDYRRILRELRFASTLRHPNVVKFMGALPSPDLQTLGIVFERWDTTLSRVLKNRKQRLDVTHVQYFMYQMLKAIEYLHGSGVVHCDIKPENILIMENCRLSLTDFGMSMTTRADLPYELVQTSWYRAPEVVMEQAFNSAIDIWSAGCVLAELMRGCLSEKYRQDHGALFPCDDNPVLQLVAIYKIVGSVPDGMVRRLQESISLAERQPEAYPTPPVRTAIADMIAESAKMPRTCRLPAMFKYMPEAAVDLLVSMLQFDPVARPTATDLLKHPFFHNVAERLRRVQVAPVAVSTTDIDELDLEIKPYAAPDLGIKPYAVLRAKLHDMVYPDLIWVMAAELHDDIATGDSAGDTAATGATGGTGDTGATGDSAAAGNSADAATGNRADDTAAAGNSADAATGNRADVATADSAGDGAQPAGDSAPATSIHLKR